MKKIQPFNADQIKIVVTLIDWDEAHLDDTPPLILAWAEERARTRGHDGNLYPNILNQVLDEIGWPKDQR